MGTQLKKGAVGGLRQEEKEKQLIEESGSGGSRSWRDHGEQGCDVCGCVCGCTSRHCNWFVCSITEGVWVFIGLALSVYT